MIGKEGESILGCWVMSRAITATVSAHSHLDSRVRDVPGNSLHPTMPGTGGLRGFDDVLDASSLKMTSGFDDVRSKHFENYLLKFQIVHHCQNDKITVLSVADAHCRQQQVTVW